MSSKPDMRYSSAGKRIAILYVTMNDFQIEAATSCVSQDYDDFRLFVLDDSTEKEIMAEVDRFKEQYEDKVTVIREQPCWIQSWQHKQCFEKLYT